MCFVYMYFSIFSKLIVPLLLMCGCLYDEIKIYIYIIVSYHTDVDRQVVDIGANIGYYTLLAAKLGQQVVAVEPVLDSIQRLQHAAHIEDVMDRIVVVYNGIANMRTKATLRQSGHNQGDSRIELNVCSALTSLAHYNATVPHCLVAVSLHPSATY